jgi:hypothetical protein
VSLKARITRLEHLARDVNPQDLQAALQAILRGEEAPHGTPGRAVALARDLNASIENIEALMSNTELL